MTRAITIDVIDALAEAEGVDPTDLDIILEDYVDTTALERLANRDDISWRLSFDVGEYDVTVAGDGTVVVTSDRHRRRPRC